MVGTLAVVDRFSLRRLGAGVGVPLMLLTAACGDDSSSSPDVEAVAPEGFAATPQFLGTVAEQSEAESSRLEMWISMSGVPDTSAEPFITAEQDGGMMSMHMDMAVMMEQMVGQSGQAMPPGMADMDMSTDMIVDGTDLYMHMPMLAEIAGASPAAGVDPAFAEALADWGYIDMTRVSDVDALMESTGGQQVDPAMYLDTLASATGAEELEATEVRGTPMRGISATVTFGDLIAAQGMTPEDFTAGMPEGADDAYAEMLDLETDLSAWVDGEGRLGRLQYSLDFAELMGSAAGDGMPQEDLDGAQAGFGPTEMTYVMDMFDYGEPSIAVEVPSGATDITEQYTAFSEFSQQAPTGPTSQPT